MNPITKEKQKKKGKHIKGGWFQKCQKTFFVERTTSRIPGKHLKKLIFTEKERRKHKCRRELGKIGLNSLASRNKQQKPQ